MASTSNESKVMATSISTRVKPLALREGCKEIANRKQ
jgi:hypothetical protein